MPSEDHFSTAGHADLILEVSPDPAVFDTVRRAVVDDLEDDYTHVLGTDVREHVRIDVVEMNAATWAVEGKLNDGCDVGFDTTVRASGAAADDVIGYLRRRIDARYGPHVEASVVVFDRIALRPAAWFVDAKIPPSPPDTDK